MELPHPSRRKFLRAALAAPALGAAVHVPKLAAQEAPVAAGGAIVSRVILDQEIYDSTGVLNGQILFRTPASGPVVTRWLDSFGRVVKEARLQPSASGVAPQAFSFDVSSGLTYRNWIRVWVNGAEQTAGAEFLISPPPKAWDDFHVISWAHYPDGFYGLLRKAGVDGTIAYRDGDFTNVLDNDVNFYVEQMAWEVFSIYHKNQPLWRGLLAEIESNRDDLKLWVRKPCVNDPKTDEYVREHLTKFVRQHRDFRPLFYNIADELGQGDQIKPNDFCHSPECTVKFAEYLRSLYGPAVASVGREWSRGEFTHWDDVSMRNGAGWLKRGLLIDLTTTDRAFSAVAVAAFRERYGSLAGLNAAWGTRFPAPRGAAAPAYLEWGPLLAAVAETRSIPHLTEAALEQKLGPLDRANERWGTHTTWGAPDEPAGFGSWAEVVTFVNRFYRELAQVRSTKGWNVSPWCDFRNFMDATFADAIGRAREVCKTEDPHGRCSTEGGQCPFAFGWYNYENVTRVVDVIEPYNIGNNVEVIRSLNSNVIMVSTHGFEHHPGKTLNAADRLTQKRALRPIWWGLFHGHRGSLIWDDNLPEYRFINPGNGELTPSAETFAALFLELRRGIGKLIINSRRMRDGVAIHYSQPSMQVHWLLDNVKNAREWMLHSGGDRYSHFTGLRNSWTKLIEDLGLQYDFVGRRDIEEGKLGAGNYRAFILPQSIAVSPREAGQLREFVRNGGLLIADCRVAEMNDHGRDLGRGQLDDLFGIARGSAKAKEGTATGKADFESLHLQGQALHVTVGDEAMSATSGKALAHSGGVPLVILNTLGQGKTVFLNLEIASYAYDRLQSNSSTSLPELMRGILKLADIEPKVRVLDASGNRLPGTEVVRFANGGCEHVAIFRNPQFDDGGWGNFPVSEAPGWAGDIDNSLLEQPAAITIELPSAIQVYDVRGRRDLGVTAKFQATLDPWEPLVFTHTPHPLPALIADVPQQAQGGGWLAVTLRNEAPLPGGAVRVVRLKFSTPDGRPYGLYARNVLVTALPHVERIALAVNDPKGRWRASAHDLITGRTSTAEFTIT